MNIYIKVEVRARELDGRLLLGLIAAERGHEVLLGDFRTLLSHRQWLPPGVFHDKALVPSAHRVAYRDGLLAAGFTITSQDEEHGLTSDLEHFVRSRFSEASVVQAEALFAWGPRDASALAAELPEAAPRVVMTGSPRVDMWRPEVAAYHLDQFRDRGGPAGHVLLLTNSGVGTANPWWERIADLRATIDWTDDGAAEDAVFAMVAAGVARTRDMVRAIRTVARELPDVDLVLRPHPEEGVAAWARLVGDFPNLRVVRSGSVSGWIRSARLVVHSGSTTGYEAAVGGVPTAAYIAGGYGEDLEVNRLGRRARTPDELVELVRASGEAAARATWFDEEDRRALVGTFAALDGRLAADRIVDAWESMPPREGLDRRFGARRALALAHAHRAVGRVRTAIRGGTAAPFRTAHKFPPFRRGEVEALAARHRSTLDRFGDVAVEVVGPRLVRMHRVRRTGRSRTSTVMPG